MKSPLEKFVPRRGRERGQVLVLFAGGLIALLVIAALAFDVGMVFAERRDEQNAADAAALAGARYLNQDSAISDPVKAEAAARAVATTNGFTNGVGNQVVNVYIPAIHGRYANFPNFIEVQIQNTRPSIFGGVIGRSTWPVGVFAVATNGQNLRFQFSMLALNQTMCKAVQVSGTGVVNAYAGIQSNSNGSGCPSGGPIGFSRTGGSTVNVFATDATCRSVSQIQDQGSGSMTCTQAQNSFALPDPLRNLAAPAQPALADPMVSIPAGLTVPPYCPGGTPAPNASSPHVCDLVPTGAYKNKAWILSPGLYPGGLSVTQGAVAYLLPGIYWIGGGGVNVQGGSIFTIATAADANADVTLATWGGGVMIYNSQLAVSGGAGGPISMNSGSARMKLKPLNVPSTDPNAIYNNIVIFQDRTVTTGVTLNGGSSQFDVLGVIYVPGGHVQLNGSSSTLNVDQIIADSFTINGSGGTINVLHNAGIDAVIAAAGLVD
jgi:hypothetical protein